MNFVVTELSMATVLCIEGNILQDDLAMFQNRLHDLIETGHHAIVLDMHLSTYISSMGLAALIEAKLRLEQKKGDIRLAGVGMLVRNLLETTRLIEKFKVFGSVEEAAESFAA